MTPLRYFIMSAALAAGMALAGPPAAAASAMDASQTREAAQLLMELAAIPSQSADREAVGRAASWIEDRFRALGFETRRLNDSLEHNPLLFAQRRVEAPAFCILFYMHYDTQPPGPAADWASTGGEPFAPKLLSGEWDQPGTRTLELSDLDPMSAVSARIYGRGSADDKAPIVMHLLALRRWLASPASRRLQVKYLLDGEEEAGSPHMSSALRLHRELLKADLLVLCDGPMDALGRPSVYLGTRGDMHMRLKVRTADLPAHSGNYSLLPNAAWRLASLLATMKDPNGRVTVEGFMDDVVPPTPEERSEMREASLAEPAIARRLGVSRFEGDSRTTYYERLLFAPALNINHLSSGRSGNQIPNLAEAILEIRLVTRQEPARVFERFRRHVQSRMPEAELELLDAVPAARMEGGDPGIRSAISAIQRAAGADPIVFPSLGGTLPLLATFQQTGQKYLGLPLVNFDNNQHVGNENLKVSALEEGIGLVARLLEELAAHGGQ